MYICVANFLYFGSFYLLIPTLPQYVAHLGGSASHIGLVMGIFTFSSILIRPYLARLADAHGRRRVLLISSACFAVLFVPYIRVQTMIPLFAVRIAHGIAHGAYLAAAFAYIGDLAPIERRGEVIGIFAASNVLSMALFPGLGIWLLNYSEGNFSLLFTISVVAASLSFLAVAMINEMKTATGKAETMSILAIVRQRAVWVSSLALFAGATVYGAVTSFLPVYAPQRGLKNFGIFFTVYAASTLLSRVLTGRLSDRVGRSKVVLPFMGLLAVAVFLFPFLHSVAMLILIGTCFGLGFGAYMPTLNALIVDETLPKDRGRAIAILPPLWMWG